LNHPCLGDVICILSNRFSIGIIIVTGIIIEISWRRKHQIALQATSY